MFPFKKIICLFLALATLFSICGCTKKENNSISYGKIEEMNIENEELIEADSNYKQVPFSYANLSFNIPQNWSYSFKNARVLNIVDENGHSFTLIGSPLYGGEETLIPSQLENIFTEDLEAIDFLYETELLHETYIESPIKILSTNLNTNTDINYSMLFYSNVYLKNDIGTVYDSTMSAIHTNIIWNDKALSLRTIAKENDLPRIENEIVQILSSFKCEEENSPALLDYYYTDINFKLPEAFEEVSIQGEKVLLASTHSSSKYSGIGISIKDLNIDLNDKLKIAKEITPALCRSFLPSGSYTVIGSIPEDIKEITLFDKKALFFSENLSYISKEYEPGGFYGKEGAAILFIYLLPEGDEIVLFAPASQIDAAIEIDTLIQFNTQK